MTTEQSHADKSENSRFPYKKVGLLVFLVSLFCGIYFTLGDQLTLESLAQHETTLKTFQQSNPIMVYGAAFLFYVLVTGLNIPGAAIMTLVFGWYFQFWPSLVLVSFASTTGATMAFLLSRYLFRDSLQAKFGTRLEAFNAALDREGAYYLFSLRLIPAVPFFVINLVMGLTRIPVWTFWWVSQIGMLAGTAVYVYAGSRVPSLQKLAEEGVESVFTPVQLTQITIAFVLLGLFPITVKKILGTIKPDTSEQIGKTGEKTPAEISATHSEKES